MYKDLLNGSKAETKFNDGATIEFARRAEWITLTESDKHLFASDLFIFRVKPETVNVMLSEIQANRVTLDNCPRHYFDLHDRPLQLGEKIQCKRCGGKMSLSTVGDYVRGYEASGADPNDIVKNWYGDNVSHKIGWNSLAPVTCPHCKGYGDNRFEIGKPFKHCSICKGSGSVARCNAMLITKGNNDL